MRSRHRRVVHVAAQRHGAGRAPLAQVRCDQRLRHGAGGQHNLARSDLARGVVHAHARADHAVPSSSGASKRAGACNAAPARTAARHTMSSSSAPRQHRQPARHVDAPAARADAADVATALRGGHHVVVTPRRCSAAWASGIKPSPHTLSRGNACASISTVSRRRGASSCAQALPAGPAPTTSTSQRSVQCGRIGMRSDGV